MTISQLIQQTFPNYAANLQSLITSADEFLLDVQNQTGHNHLASHYRITKPPRAYSHGRDVMIDVEIHNLSCLQLHLLGQQRPHYLALNRQAGEMVAFSTPDGIHQLSLWVTLIDDADTEENAA